MEVELSEMWWTVLGSAAAALGAAILLANSPWGSVSQQPYELSLLEKASLKRLDGSEAVVEGRELWHEKGAVIMVVRRPG